MTKLPESDTVSIEKEKVKLKMKKFIKNYEIDFSKEFGNNLSQEIPNKYRNVIEIFSDGDKSFGKIVNQKTKELVTGERADYIKSIITAYFFPQLDPYGEYDKIIVNDLNPEVVVKFDF